MAASSSSARLPPRTSAFTPISEEAAEEEEEAAAAEGTTKNTAARVLSTRCRPGPAVVGCSSASPTVRTLFSTLSCRNSVYSFASPSASHSDRDVENPDRNEASRLREKVSEMEKKIARLESYSSELRSALHRVSGAAAGFGAVAGDPSFPVADFLAAVTESRATARHLSRVVVGQFLQAERLDRIPLVLRRFGVDATPARGRRASRTGLALCMEAVLSRVFYRDFESPGFQPHGSGRVLEPAARCERNRRAYGELRGLEWEEVLRGGTRQRSEELSRFCDRRMRELVEVLGWSGPWPEPLLRSFFGLAKWVWLVHLLAGSVHPMVPIFRVGRGEPFHPGYMDDAMGGPPGTGPGPGPVLVGVTVAPGFYVYDGVIKCKVIVAAPQQIQ